MENDLTETWRVCVKRTSFCLLPFTVDVPLRVLYHTPLDLVYKYCLIDTTKQNTYLSFHSLLFFFDTMQQHIDRDKLYNDGAYRFQYVTNFMDFGMS